MTVSVRPRTFAVVYVLYSRQDLGSVRALLEAFAPDQQLTFLLVEDESLDETEARAFRADLLGTSALAYEALVTSAMLSPDHVYFAPRARLSAMHDGELQYAVHDSDAFDAFLESVAGDLGRRACVVIMAGAIKANPDAYPAMWRIADADGLVLAQDSAGGEFRRLTRAPAFAQTDDAGIAPDDLPQLLLEHAEPLIAESRPRATSALYEDVEAALPALCELLLDVTGHDFSGYKPTTLIRRSMRRVHLSRAGSAAAYLERLRNDRAETARLFNDLLVSVTSFFRDPEAFESLTERVLQPLLAKPRGTDPVRIWIAGCASGEEAYTIAILVRELRAKLSDPPAVTIFATDIDDQALSVARRGRYAAARMTHVSAERVEQNFSRDAQNFQVNKSLRDMVLFTRHSLNSDPPFIKLDLLLCRNVLIYFGDTLQQQVVPLFHHALRPSGHLVLGPSESLATHPEHFRPTDARNRIYERVGTMRASPTLMSRGAPSRVMLSTNGDGTAEALRELDRVLAEQYTPRGVVVTDEGQVVAASGDLTPFLSVTSGLFVNSISRLVRDGLRVPMRAALREAIVLRARVTNHGGMLHTAEGAQRVAISAQPLSSDPLQSGLFLVVFQLEGPVHQESHGPSQHTSSSSPALVERLELDLAAVREELHRTVQDLEATNEELKSSNEELISMNEELQSSNEELEASKDDLLYSNAALEALNSDLDNLLTSTQIPTLFLGQDGRVRRATASMHRIYNIRPDDAGRPLAHFTHQALEMPELPTCEIVNASDDPIEDLVALRDGSWMRRRVLPYRTRSDERDGLVVTFTDVTAYRRYQEALRQSEMRLRGVIDAMFAFVGLVDTDGVLREANKAPLEAGGLSRDEVIGLPFWDCAWWTHDEAVRDRLRSAFARALQGEVVRYDEVIRVADDGRIVIDFMLQPVCEQGVVQFVIPSAVDVTHRVEADAQLRYQRDLTRSITDNATTAIFMVNSDGICTFANPAAEQMTGYTIDELVDSDLHALLHQHEADTSTAEDASCSLVRAWTGPAALRNHRDTFVSRNGEEYPVVCNARTVEGGNERRDTVLEVRDVTEEHRAAREVEESQARFQQLAETIPQLAVMAMPDGEVVWFNQRWFDYTGTTMEEVAGWGWASAHDPEVLPTVVEAWQHSLQTGTSFSIVAPLRGADGTYRPFLIRLEPFRDESGNLSRWFGTCTDVSEERARSEALRRRERELQALADSSPDILTRFDRSYRHAFVNEAVTRATGLPVDAYLGRTSREMGMPAELCDMWEEAIDRVFETGEQQHIDFRYDSPSGTSYFVGQLSPELGPDGTVEYALGVTRDCTAERVATLALQDANMRKDEFLATLAHELRNPLAPLRNALEILRLSEDDGRSAAVRAIMDRQIETMTRLIDDLLDISRISLGKLDLKRSRVSLATIIDDAIEISRPPIDAAHHGLVQRRSDDAMVLDADGTRLAQAIGNLLINAAKFTPDRGEITIETTREHDCAVIRVRDTGVGIPEDMLGSIFEMFTQIDAPRKPKVGLGIGLALVRQLVEMHGGTVHAESDGEGAGSTFVVRLPLSIERSDIDHTTTDKARTRKADGVLRVLVVDDNIDAAESLKAVFALMGHDAECAYSGEAALACLDRSAPDIVFSDIGLPDVSGHELATRIRKMAGLERTVLVAVTGWGSDADRHRSASSGFDFHLTKPASIDALRRILERTLIR